MHFIRFQAKRSLASDMKIVNKQKLKRTDKNAEKGGTSVAQLVKETGKTGDRNRTQIGKETKTNRSRYTNDVSSAVARSGRFDLQVSRRFRLEHARNGASGLLAVALLTVLAGGRRSRNHRGPRRSRNRSRLLLLFDGRAVGALDGYLRTEVTRNGVEGVENRLALGRSVTVRSVG